MPSGNPNGGQWTNGEGDSGSGFGFAPDGTPVDPAARRPRSGDKRPDSNRPGSDTGKQPEYKKPKSGLSGKESASDVPSWVRESGDRPLVGEDGKSFAKRVLDKKYPDLKGQHDTGPTSDFSRIKKWADRHFE